MPGLIIAFISSFILTLLIIRLEYFHGRISMDADLSGPQKFHLIPVPRVGGLAVALSLALAIFYRSKSSPNPEFEFTLLACAFPTFAIGLTEDFTKKVGVKTRLIVTGISAILAVIYLGAIIPRLDIPWIDGLFTMPGFAIFFTIFAIAGLSNAYNIIDGLNGLASMVGIISLIAIGYIGYLVGDLIFFSLSFAMIGAILGFFVWNYPKGSIFLGDGGSYLIGFWIAVLSILLVVRNPTISPWFAILINAYPALETLFTIYRRKIHQGKSPGQADGMHFHSLLYRRVLKLQNSRDDSINANSKTSPYLWILSGVPVMAAMLWWRSTPILGLCLLLFITTYIWIYQKIVRFKTPRFLHFF